MVPGGPEVVGLGLPGGMGVARREEASWDFDEGVRI